MATLVNWRTLGRFDVAELSGDRVRGTRQKFDKTRHCAGTYIKAVTLHQFRVEPLPDGWSAPVYLDV